MINNSLLTEAYLQPSQRSMVPFRENSQQLIAAYQFRKSSIRDFPMGSKYAFGLSYGEKIGRYEFT